ncbi:IPExxxVDY family protein [Flavobacterium sp. UBA6135]|uniref:IPExxxVDY family protein n=1 Tax=Flavobacterium sp. UBA6135 TaxID=1946553 RepID=UPI0025B99037|nr:IPExxxVDY family protein [Flavobacterium sp. UBA6135]
MAVHKLVIDDFEEADFQLIAIHTTLEDYRLAYFINQNLPILLSRSKKEIQTSFQTIKTGFTRFVFEDPDNQIAWNLIENKKEIAVSQKNKGQTLFENSEEFTTTLYLVPEYKKVDFFFKIDAEKSQVNIAGLMGKIKNIPSLTTLYQVDKSKIKSKNNLIF